MNKTEIEEYYKFLEFLKEEEYYKALDYVFSKLWKTDRCKFMLTVIKCSRYRTYSIAMKNFVTVVERFFIHKEKEDLITYRENLVTDYYEPFYEDFTEVRRCFITDLLEDKYELNMTSAVRICYNGTFNEKGNEEIKNLALEAATLKWEQAKTIKVLYGK